jgi:hypothetical protein
MPSENDSDQLGCSSAVVGDSLIFLLRTWESTVMDRHLITISK